MLDILFQPKIFNYVTMGLYTANIAWQFFHSRPIDACYWMSALSITAVVTFGYQR